MSDPIVLDTPEQMQMFHFMQVLYALRVEVNTGLKMSRGSVLKLAQERYGVTARTKKGALEQMAQMYEEATGRVFAR